LQKKIFDPFSPPGSRTGTGLGLSIVDRIVAVFGYIEVESVPARANFSVYIPQYRREKKAEPQGNGHE
jgi:nitrogen-specific signal transduction histidine kinase